MTRLLPCRVSVCGVGELDGFARAGVSDVLSIINPDMPEPEAFRNFARHRRTTLRFHDVVLPTDGQTLCGDSDVGRILDFGRRLAAQRSADHLLVHCMAGISRSTAAAAILMAQPNPGREDEAFEALLAIRPRAWPNSRMVALADRLLERQGRLEAALRRYFARAVGEFEGLADDIRSVDGRGHEVPPS
ncbi:MAG: protein-tyrosine-phosphatase [Alphaproteobacteria bacterium]|nr:protein-tyrosine-phosphatase [Alphaproteobacteria bacterium]